MYETITITMKNETFAKWEKGEWDDYCYDGKCFIVVKERVRVGFYNVDEIKSIVIE